MKIVIRVEDILLVFQRLTVIEELGHAQNQIIILAVLSLVHMALLCKLEVVPSGCTRWITT